LEKYDVNPPFVKRIIAVGSKHAWKKRKEGLSSANALFGNDPQAIKAIKRRIDMEQLMLQ